MKRVVLVRPMGPRNAGAVVRACANFGPVELVFVAPERRSLLVHPDFVQMAHGVSGSSERLRVVATLAEALDGCTAAIAFTARAHDHRRRHDWREVCAQFLDEVHDPESTLALVFGNEERGLESADVAQCRDLVHIATSTEHTSINLAVSVAIVLADLFAAPRVPRHRERGAKPLGAAGREFLKANLKHALGEKVARSKSAKSDILASIERIFSRAELEDRDARAWHLMCRALGSELTPKDMGLVTHEKRGRRRVAIDERNDAHDQDADAPSG